MYAMETRSKARKMPIRVEDMYESDDISEFGRWGEGMSFEGLKVKDVIKAIDEFQDGEMELGMLHQLLLDDDEIPEERTANTLLSLNGGAWHKMMTAAELVIDLMNRDRLDDDTKISSLEQFATMWPNEGKTRNKKKDMYFERAKENYRYLKEEMEHTVDISLALDDVSKKDPSKVDQIRTLKGAIGFEAGKISLEHIPSC